MKYKIGIFGSNANVISTANCDAGIIISGRWGTLNEFTNLYDMGKIIGVLTNTGGVADELPVLTQTSFWPVQNLSEPWRFWGRCAPQNDDYVR